MSNRLLKIILQGSKFKNLVRVLSFFLKQFFLSILIFSSCFAEFQINDLYLRSSVENLKIPESGLKIMWWNIGCGLETGDVKKKSELKTTNLELNLIRLSNSNYKPDVMILGEYCPYTMSKKDQSELEKSYKYNFHLERNIPLVKTASGINQRNGILILSDYKVETLVNEVLFSTSSKTESVHNRKYLLVKIIKNKKEYFINPVHLVNPWRDLYEKKGKLGVFSELTSGDQNSNAVQIKNLIENYNKYLDTKALFMSIGDFNSPGSIFGFSGFGYNQMSLIMKPLMLGHKSTFLGDGPFPASDIDHAFGINIKSLYSEVWPLEGSRHLPIYLVIDEA
jgi:hypothetical protein